jgi:hypothetical protein
VIRRDMNEEMDEEINVQLEGWRRRSMPLCILIPIPL